MNEKVFCALLYVLLSALSIPADAQQTEKVFRVGFLDPSTAAGSADLLEHFGRS